MKRNNGRGIPEDTVIDDEFLKYFHFVCDVICYRNGESPQGKSSDEFDMLSEYFTGDSEEVRRNIETMEAYFDCWCDLDDFSNPTEFLNSCMSHEHTPGKTLVDARYKTDIFEDCLHAYADMSGRLRQFPLNRIVLLYAVVCYLRNRASITASEYARRLRTINNLIQNSEDEISDRTDRNRMPAVLRQTESIMLTGVISEAIENSFNASQITEEREKKAYLAEHPEQEERICALEDHPVLRGQISIVGLDHIELADRFASLFACDPDLIDCALMAIGDYGQQERNKWRYQYGSRGMQTAWADLFHRSANSGFERTSGILAALLSRAEVFTNELLRGIADEFLHSCEDAGQYPWRYYYIKYKAFRPGSYGKYSNDNAAANPYMFSVMQTRFQWSSSTYMPFLKEADAAHLSRDAMGQRLVYGDRHIICRNNAFVLRSNESEEVIETVEISQNGEGIDTEDRVALLRQMISRLGYSVD